MFGFVLYSFLLQCLSVISFHPYFPTYFVLTFLFLIPLNVFKFHPYHPFLHLLLIFPGSIRSIRFNVLFSFLLVPIFIIVSNLISFFIIESFSYIFPTWHQILSLFTIISSVYLSPFIFLYYLCNLPCLQSFFVLCLTLRTCPVFATYTILISSNCFIIYMFAPNSN